MDDVKNEYVKNVINTVLPWVKPLLSGISVSVISAPRVGKNIRINHFLRDYRSYAGLDKKFVQELDERVFLWIDLTAGRKVFYSLLKKDLRESIASVGGLENGTIQDSIDGLVTQLIQKKKIIFIINDANLLYQDYIDFAVELYRLNRKFPEAIQFLFLFSEEIYPSEDILKAIPPMGPIMLGKIEYFKLLQQDDISNLLDLRSAEVGNSLSKEMKGNILEVSGGHPALMRILLRIIAESGSIPAMDELLDNNEVSILFYSTWLSFSEKAQKVIREDTFIENEYLLSTGLVNSEGKWFSELFNRFIEKIDTSDIFIKEDVLFSVLSYSQKLIFDFLRNNKENVSSKEDIAKIMWEDGWLDKYSEWTIEKTISNIRRKLPSRFTLKSVYGKGYVLTES